MMQVLTILVVLIQDVEIKIFFFPCFRSTMIYFDFSYLWSLKVACGKRAGAFTCLLDETGRYNAPEYENVEFKPDYKVTSLVEILPLLEKNFNLAP